MSDDSDGQPVWIEDVRGLRVDMQKMTKSVDGLAQKQTATDKRVTANEEQIATNERLSGRANLNSIGAAVAVVIALIAVAVFWNAQRTQHDRDVASRNESKAAACVHYNDQAASEKNLWHGLLTLPGVKQPDAATLAAFNALLDETFPARDCSPAGIAAYYANGGK